MTGPSGAPTGAPGAGRVVDINSRRRHDTRASFGGMPDRATTAGWETLFRAADVPMHVDPETARQLADAMGVRVACNVAKSRHDLARSFATAWVAKQR